MLWALIGLAVLVVGHRVLSEGPWSFHARYLSCGAAEFRGAASRLFLMRTRMFGVPVEAFHRLIDGHATMQVKVASLVQIVDARGDEMDRAETVTLFNDMCILAPGTLIEPDITWEQVDASVARAHFTHHGHTITATLFFDPDGRLVNFESDDRARSSPDGTFTKLRFSTPLRDYRDFGPLRLAGHGEARWRLPGGSSPTASSRWWR